MLLKWRPRRGWSRGFALIVLYVLFEQNLFHTIHRMWVFYRTVGRRIYQPRMMQSKAIRSAATGSNWWMHDDVSTLQKHPFHLVDIYSVQCIPPNRAPSSLLVFLSIAWWTLSSYITSKNNNKQTNINVLIILQLCSRGTSKDSPNMLFSISIHQLIKWSHND